MEPHEQMLLIPIKVKALIAGNEKYSQTEFAGPTVNFSAVRQEENITIQMEPFTKHSQLEKGVHLHWFLPEYLVHGVKEAEEEDVKYPYLPDRWIVTRVEIRQGFFNQRKICCKSFQIESNAVSNENSVYNDGSIRVPVESGNWFLGRSGEYGRLPAGGIYAEELTADSYGEPGFYAYYPNCRNVFGFYDAMEDVQEHSQLFYQVCGWFSKREHDPVGGLSGEALAERIKEMEFEFSRQVPRKGSLFWNPSGEGNALLLHGACYGLVWEGDKTEYDTGVPAATPDISVGNTSVEAFAALLASQSKAMDYKSERILNSFLGDMVELWADIDGAILVEEEIHREAFQPVAGGSLWDLRSEDEEIDERKHLELRESLENLNRLEQEMEKNNARLDYVRKQAGFAWYRYKNNKKAAAGGQAGKEWRALLKTVIRLERENLENLRTLKARRRDFEKIAAGFCEIRKIPAPRYWTPNEPVILLSGVGMEQKYQTVKGAGGDGEKLKIRTFSQLVTSVRIQKEEQESWVESRYLWSYVSVNADLPLAVKYLIEEALLLAPECAPVMAYEALLIMNQEVLDGVYEQLETKLEQRQRDIWEKDKGEDARQSYLGALPDQTGVNFFSPPWNPLYMEWGITYTPENSKNLDKWELEEIDYSLTKILPINEPCKYRGRAVLTPHVQCSVSEIMKRYQNKARKTEGDAKEFLEMLETYFGQYEMLSQRLSGFNSNFLTQRETVQGGLKDKWEQNEDTREVFADMEAEEEEQEQILMRMEEAIDTQPYISAVFSPSRNGSARISELRIIDSFGQLKEIVQEEEYERRSSIFITEQMDSSMYDQTMILTPRIVQPARLDFQWVKEKDGIIYGWLVPDYIDHSLMVFGASGKLYGTFLEIWGEDGTFSFSFQESRAGSGQLEELESDERIKRFIVLFMKEMGANIARMNQWVRQSEDRKGTRMSAFHRFVSFLCEELNFMSLPGMAYQKNLMHFVGRPLALADAKIGIETMTPLWKSQSWEGEGEKNILEDLEFPIRLGDQRKRAEGLVGFFKKEGQEGNLCRHFYGYGSKEGTGYVRFDNRISVFVNRMVCHTLLFDPAQAIHLISGIFPVSKVRLKEDEALKAQSRLNMEMLINPVLLGKEKLRLPLALLPGKTWSFIMGNEGARKAAPAGTSAFEETYPLHLAEGWLKMEKEGEETSDGESALLFEGVLPGSQG